MTLRLLLIRHAKSDQDAADLADHERPLNARGRRDAPRMGAWIADRGFAPDEVLCSYAQRTRETLDLMLPLWPAPPRVSHRADLYHADPGALLAALAGATGRTVALVGHNPGIGQLAGTLAGQAPAHPRWADFPTASVAVLAFEGATWSEIGEGEVLAYAIPADLA